MTSGTRVHWEGVYQRKLATEVSWYEPSPATSISFLRASNVRPTDPIIDVGGGASHRLRQAYPADCMRPSG
jgi:hypothetical protein